jgi:predicted ATPase
MSATGVYIPPMIIFPRAKLHPGLINGWSYFINHTASSLSNKVRVILDNHESHLSANVLELCRKNGVILLSLPPHT